MVLHSFVYHVYVILILAHIRDAFGFPCKIGCDTIHPDRQRRMTGRASCQAL
jgi:hypothetical protein